MGGEGGRGCMGLAFGVGYPDESVLVSGDAAVDVEHIESVVDTVDLQRYVH